MLSSKALKEIVAEARPIIERQINDALKIAAFREVVTAQGGDWSSLKALIKAQVQDEGDDGKRVEKILAKAEFATGYADMLGWSKMNENNFSADEEEFNPFTGEITESPRKAAEAVAEMPRNNPVANVEEGATGAIAAASNDPASRTDENGERQHSSTVGFTGDCRTEGKEQSDASAASVGDAAADAHGIPATNSPIAPASQGEAEAPTPKDVSLPADGVSSEGAATGGSHVTASENAATQQAGALVKIAPAAKHPALLLRPHCQHPGEAICGGSGRNHCRKCTAAMREEEVV